MFRGEDNSYVAECAREQPERFAAVCVVDPRVPGAENRLEHWVVEKGCRGLRLRPRVAEEAAVFGDPSTFPLWERVRKLSITINVLASPEHLDTINLLAGRFPEVPIIVDHMAHPFAAEGANSPGFRALLELAQHARVLVKISGYYYFSKQVDPYRDCWDLVRALYDRFGPERLMWGSDFPHVERRTGYARCLELARRELPFFSGNDRAKILGQNALGLYWGA
jgi:predicted TIM-barrel fold metal-dependent hydrolase